MIDTRAIVPRVERPDVQPSTLWLGAASYEGDENTAIAFTIVRESGFSQVVTIDWAITGASVTPSSGVYTFQAGEGLATILVMASEVASTEVGSLAITNPQNLSGGPTPLRAAPSTAVFTVTNVVVVTDIDISLSAAAYSGFENTNISFVVNRAGGESTDIVSVDWAITGVTTIPASGTVTFNIGETQKVIPVAANEVVVDDVGALTLSNPQNLSAGVTPTLIAPSAATFTVLNVVASAPILDTITYETIQELNNAPGNTSDIMYNPNTGNYHTVINNVGGDQDVYSESGNVWTHVGDVGLSLSEQDTEGCCWVSGTRYAISGEGFNRVYIVNGTSQEQAFTFPPRAASNQGLEGVSYASEAELAQGGQPPGLYNNGALYTCQEGASGSMRVWRMEMPPFDGQDYSYNYPTSGDALSTLTEFSGTTGGELDSYLRGFSCNDLAALVFDPRNGDGRLILLSESSRQLFEVTIGGVDNDRLTYVTDIPIDSSFQWEGICISPEGDLIINSEGNNGSPRVQRLTYTGAGAIEATPVIATTSHVIAQPFTSVMNKTISLDSGGPAVWYIKKGPPSATIDPDTGVITWTPSDDLPRGQGVSFRIGCYNSFGHATPISFIVHVNNTGQTGTLHVTGEAGISEYIGPASEQISSGDTLVVTGSSRFVHAVANTDYLNGFIGSGTSGTQYTPPAGTNSQLTTICAEDPYLMVDGSPHGAVTSYSNYGLFIGSGQGEYLKFMDFSYKKPQRQVANIGTDNTFLEGMGFYDSGYANFPPPSTYNEADNAYASLAVVIHTGASSCLTEMCHAGGQGRYMFQNGSGASDDNVRRWCVARPDEYHGDQPRGGFIYYSTQGDRDYNCTLIDGNQEDFASFYKNPQGGYANPATGSESRPLDQERHRCGILNTEMCAFGIMDASSGASQAASWDDHWGFEFTAQVAPQSGNGSNSIIQSSSQDCHVNRASLGRAMNHNNGTRTFISSDSFLSSIVSECGWNGTTVVDMGSLGNTGSFSGTLYNFLGSSTVTPTRTTNPHDDGWEYLPRVEPGSTLDVAGDGAQAAFLKGKPYHKKSDVGHDDNTAIPAWPHPMEDVFRTHNKAYFKTGLTKRLDEFGGATGTVDGDRGFCVDGETFTEYVWGYLGFMLPPLRVAHKIAAGTVTFFNAPLESFRENDRTGWRVYKTTDLVNPVVSVTSRTGSVAVAGLTSGDYVITNTFSTYTPSNWMNGDESGPSIQTLTVTI